MYFPRHAAGTVKELLSTYPVVTVTGPRQSGKTTLAKEVASHLPYVNLEDLREREFALNDPIKFIEQYKDGAVIDEIQRAPDLTSQIQVAVDESNRKGVFLLTGSHQFEVLEKVSQSLAGRSSVFTLLPLAISEVISQKPLPSTDALILHGLYPRIQAENLKSVSFYQDYVATYLERDLRQISEIRNLETFRRFLKLTAGHVGQVLDVTKLGEAVGVSQTTARAWLNLLQASYIIFLLQPYHANIKKRIVKRPKLYFYDVGLAAFLLDISKESHVAPHPLRGALFENLVVVEAVKSRFNAHMPNNFYFYRDKSGKEVDLLQQQGPELTAFEIKSGKTISSDYFHGLDALKRTGLNIKTPQYIIYDGDRTQQRSDVTILPLAEFARQSNSLCCDRADR